jgi:Predicted Zn-dependent proteases and their inactivated homologs
VNGAQAAPASGQAAAPASAASVASGQAASTGTASSAKAAPVAGTQNNLLLDALSAELMRSYDKLKGAGSSPLYFLCYRIYDSDVLRLRASYGAIERDDQDSKRLADVEARVGNMQMDSSHKLRESFAGMFDRMFGGFLGPVEFSIDDDEAAIRTALWLVTDATFKKAQSDYIQVKANRDVKVSEEDQSADFSVVRQVVSVKPTTRLNIDVDAWKARLRRLSAIYKEFPEITNSSVELQCDVDRRYVVNNEGTRVVTEDRRARVFSRASAIADDGMVVTLFDSAETFDPRDLPSDKVIEEKIRKLAAAVVRLRKAKIAEPYVGPAIIRCRAAGVFFHEVLGHRVEGHRQKDEDEGRTFAKKVGKQIMPEFISVYDDPTLSRLGKNNLVGNYSFDNEGVPAQRVNIVERGVLKNFLMGRSPIHNFNKSNGHCRSSPGNQPVARQGNLIVECKKTVPYKTLKAMLLAEARKQGKPYGLIFDEISGGFAITDAFFPQSFQLLPLQVTRVWVDGRPDELLRGVNLVGTPLASLETIQCAADDLDTFNGVCGAESGWVPVSASSPSLLVRTLEVAREYKEQDKPPILPPPLADRASTKSKEAAAK